MSKNIKLLLGPEEGLKLDKLKELTKDLENQYSDLETTVFYAFEAEKEQIIDTIASPSLFASYRLVIIKHLEEAKNPADLYKTLSNFMPNCPNDVEIILLSTKYQGSFPQALLKHVDKQNIFTFYELFDSDKQKWVINYFKKEGLNIEFNAVLELLNLVDNNTYEMKSYANLLVSFFLSQEGKNTITEDDIIKYLSHTKAEDGFTLFNHILSLDLNRALSCLKNITNSKSSYELFLIIIALSRQFRLFESYLTIARKSVADAEKEASAIGAENSKKGINFKDKRLFSAARSKFNLQDVDRILSLLNKADIDVRKENDPVLYLELLVYKIIVNKGKVTSLDLKNNLLQ